jgi:hypothetical protein
VDVIIFVIVNGIMIVVGGSIRDMYPGTENP